jgi:hypothetical protein
MPEIYRQAGDYAVATMLATQYGLAALTRLGDESDEKTSTLRGDCLAGGYTASVIIYNRPDTSTYHICRATSTKESRPCFCSATRSAKARASTACARSARGH